jgi:glutathione synthase/RimK-type ligase-like ATP-grasp enzyme
MLVGLHTNLNRGQLGLDSKRFQDILNYNKIDNLILYAGDQTFWDRIVECDFFIFQWTQRDYYRQIAQTILPIIENQLKIKCFPNHLSSWIYDDKIRQYFLLKLHGFPAIKSWIFYDIDQALNFINRAEFPLVFKLRSGAGSIMVKLLKDKKAAKNFARLMFQDGVNYDHGLPGRYFDYIKRKETLRLLRIKLGQLRREVSEGRKYFDEDWFLHKNYLFLQEYMPDNQYDTRVVIIGKQAFAFQRRNFANDFRASGSGENIYEPRHIDLKFVEVAFQVSKHFGFNSMAYDFLYDKDKKPAR